MMAENSISFGGLTSAEAKRLLTQDGANVLTPRKNHVAVSILFSQFTSPLIIILLAAGSVTGIALRSWLDTAVIGFTAGLSVALGFFQEYRAQKLLESLKLLLAPKARVIRDGKRQDIDASLLVPGDMAILEIGRIVPADGEIVQNDSLHINEAVLTGESVPVEKISKNPVFMGTTVVSGIGTMIVTKTGDRTKMGSIASSLKTEQRQETPLQQQISKLGRMIMGIVIILTICIVVLGVVTGRSFTSMLTLAVAVAVAAIPDSLAVSLTAILAMGMHRLLSRNALVHRLMAAETLGSVTAVCFDKTGTLTEGIMRVVGMDLVDEEEGKNAIAVCNDLRDPLEIAMFDAVSDARARVQKFKRTDEIPFSPSYKYIATAHPENGVLFVSGAPEVILEKSSVSATEKETWKNKFKTYAAKGLRIVCVASRPLPSTQAGISDEDIHHLKWLGVVLFEDPIREGAAEILHQAQELGLSLHVITGDYLETAENVVAKINAQRPAQNAPLDITIHARVSPEEKLAIVKDLQRQGEVVAMMGDGVNDAPALHGANISIVVSEASDVAKEAADIVLLDNNFSTVIAAVKEGRAMFATFQRVVAYLLSDSFAEVLLITAGLLLPIPVPLVAVMILWVNLVSDGFLGIALTMEKARLIVRPPTQRELFGRQLKLLVGAVSIVKGLSALAVFLIVWEETKNVSLARSTGFAALVVSSIFSAFAFRSLSRPLFRVSLFSNPVLLATALASILSFIAMLHVQQLASVFGVVPLTMFQWFLALASGLATLFVIEIAKLASYTDPTSLPVHPLRTIRARPTERL